MWDIHYPVPLVEQMSNVCDVSMMVSLSVAMSFISFVVMSSFHIWAN